MDNSPIDTEIVVIFQNGEKKNHKTVIKMIKNDSGLDVIHMDSIANHTYISDPNYIIKSALQENAIDQNRAPSNIVSFEPIFPVKGYSTGEQGESVTNYYNSQYNDFECGTFAIKYARMLAKNDHPDLVKNINEAAIDSPGVRNFVIPADFLKSTQSSKHREYIKQNYDMNQEVNPRTHKTLNDIYNKYVDAKTYANHFSQKYLNQIKEYCKSNRSKPEIINENIAKFDAGQFTVDDLKRINDARNIVTNKTHNKPN